MFESSKGGTYTEEASEWFFASVEAAVPVAIRSAGKGFPAKIAWVRSLSARDKGAESIDVG